jgi:hypothetical protein
MVVTDCPMVLKNPVEPLATKICRLKVLIAAMINDGPNAAVVATNQATLRLIAGR